MQERKYTVGVFAPTGAPTSLVAQFSQSGANNSQGLVKNVATNLAVDLEFLVIPRM